MHKKITLTCVVNERSFEFTLPTDAPFSDSYNALIDIIQSVHSMYETAYDSEKAMKKSKSSATDEDTEDTTEDDA